MLQAFDTNGAKVSDSFPGFFWSSPQVEASSILLSVISPCGLNSLIISMTKSLGVCMHVPSSRGV